MICISMLETNASLLGSCINKILEITGVDIDKVIDGKIVEHGGCRSAGKTMERPACPEVRACYSKGNPTVTARRPYP